MSALLPPMQPGQYSTDSGQDADLNKTYRLPEGVFRFVKTGAAITNAGGKTLIFTVTAGVLVNVVENTTTVNNKIAGVVPITGDIATSTTLASGTRLMVQLTGLSKVKAGNTTVIAPAALVTHTSKGFVKSMATGTQAKLALNGYIGYATNTATVAAGTAITCMLGIHG